MPHFAASDLVLHCLPMFLKKDARLKWDEIRFNNPVSLRLRYRKSKAKHFNITNKPIFHAIISQLALYRGTQWLSGRVLDSRSRGWGFEPH